ncbi:MAG: hypothetical protein ACO3SP_09835 [Ilumatobacteraceae bacterium]
MTNVRRLDAETASTSLAASLLAATTLAVAFRRQHWWRWGATIGAVSGLFAGRLRAYDWRTARGRLAFVLDHTWALTTTGAGVVVAAANQVLGSPIEHSLTTRQNRVVFERGLAVRPGFALSVGYVVSGAADRQGRVTPRRQRLVTDHEDVHIWQARRWGPLYPVFYGAWLASGAVVGLWRWRKSGRSSAMAQVDAAAYYSNPFEWRAYTEDRNWPPAGVDPALVWSRPYSPAALTAIVREWRGSREGQR